MNYTGVIIEESLGAKNVLEKVKIVKTVVEPVTSKHKTPWLTQWTLHTVDISPKHADEVAEIISTAFDKIHPHWYADYKNENYHFIIYSGKIFKVDLKNPILYEDAKHYGISLGIPSYQVDFAPNDAVWER